jgi:hypothetical protein
VFDFPSAVESRQFDPDPAPEQKQTMTVCGPFLWHIKKNSKIDT